jgi:hypothetical protein
MKPTIKTILDEFEEKFMKLKHWRERLNSYNEQYQWRADNLEDLSADDVRDFLLFSLEECWEKSQEKNEQNISTLRQWLNEDRITDPKRMITNEQIKTFLSPETLIEDTYLKCKHGKDKKCCPYCKTK